MWIVRKSGEMVNLSHASGIVITEDMIGFVVYGNILPIHESEDRTLLELIREVIIEDIAGGKLVCDLRERI